MATYKMRGESHSVVYRYIDESGKKIQHWETYQTEIEALQRKVNMRIGFVQPPTRYARQPQLLYVLLDR